MSGGDIYPNLYIALVGPAAGRKGTAMRFAKDMILDIGIPLSCDSLGSVQALYAEINDAEDSFESPNGALLRFRSLAVWAEEFAVFLSHQDSTFTKAVTELYDAPKRWKYRSLGQGIKDLDNCCLNIIGAITPSLLQESLTATALGGGLFSRIIFVVGYGRSKKVALGFLSKEEITLQRQLYEDLQLIKQTKGQFTLTPEFMDAYVPWYESAAATNGVDSDKFDGYNGRRATHLKKLCMVYSVAESNNMLITKEHFQKALSTLEYTENEMGSAFYGLGRGLHADVQVDLMQFLQKEGTTTWDKVLGKFQLDVTPSDLLIFLGTLDTIKKIKTNVTVSGNNSYTWIDKTTKSKGLASMNSSIFNKMDHKIGGR